METFKDFGSLSTATSLLLLVTFSLFAFPALSLLFLFFSLNPHHLKTTHKLHTSFIISFSTAITILEYYIPTQFPVAIGHSWIHLKQLLSLAPVAGVPIYSFISYLAIFSFSFSSYRSTKLFSLILLLFALIFGMVSPLRIPQDRNLFSVKIIQANIGNLLKLQTEKNNTNSNIYEIILKRYQALSLKKSADNFTSDLLIWPETAYPFDIAINSPIQVPPLLHQIQSQLKGSFLFGGYGTQGNNDYNSVFFSTSAGSILQSYSKHILIPFGETLPFGPFNTWVQSKFSAVSLFASGTKLTTFRHPKSFLFITPICYEILSSSFIRNYLNTSHDPKSFIVNLTNDSWYGNSTELWHHKNMAHWRALEFQLPIIRSTNTGITSILYQDGSESASIPYNKIGILEEKVILAQHPQITLYQRWGLLPFVVFALILMGGWILWERKYSIRK